MLTRARVQQVPRLARYALWWTAEFTVIISLDTGFTRVARKVVKTSKTSRTVTRVITRRAITHTRSTWGPWQKVPLSTCVAHSVIFTHRARIDTKRTTTVSHLVHTVLALETKVRVVARETASLTLGASIRGGHVDKPALCALGAIERSGLTRETPYVTWLTNVNIPEVTDHTLVADCAIVAL